MATMAYDIVGEDLVVFVSAREAPSAPEWQAYTRSIEPLVFAASAPKAG